MAKVNPPKGSGSASVKRRNKQKTPQKKTPLQRILIIGPTGKRRLDWRPWE